MSFQPYQAHDISKKYVRGIDGLRALAVLSVVVFHLDHRFLPGGFTGVDVFFVISGYVISKSLTANFRLSFFGFLLDFYKRRLVRIMPALVVCLFVTSVFSTLFVPEVWLSQANEKTGLWAFFGLSNFALISSADGYFDRRIPFNPFVHTWSLAVEEQFYLIFPIIFFLFLYFRNRKSFLVFGFVLPLLAIFSLAYSAYETSSNPNRAFYMLPSRFWQMASGALLFQVQLLGIQLIKSRNSNIFCMSLGLLLILTGFVLADKSVFPFPWALAPVAGTLLVIAGLSRKDIDSRSPWSRFFLNPSIVYVGKISYSLYLWHWPVIVLMRWTIGIDTPATIALALATSSAFAVLSYHFVETPTRRFFLKSHFQPTLIIGSVLAVTGLVFLSTLQIFDRDSTPIRALSVTSDDCVWSWMYTPQCEYSTSPEQTGAFQGRRILIAGDSHAGAYHRMLTLMSVETGAELHWFSQNGCPIADLIGPANPACGDRYPGLLREIETRTNLGDVVFLASLRMPRFIDQGTKAATDSEYKYWWESEFAQERRELALVEAESLVRDITAMNRTVLIDLPKPVFKAPAFQCSDWFNSMNPICSGGFTVSRETLEEVRSPIVESARTLSTIGNVQIWDPFPILCPNQTCSAFTDGLPLFLDGDHLSGYGNQVLVSSFVDKLSEVWSD